MGYETFKKRQKELARREKQQKKAVRRMERKNEKAMAEKQLQGENPQIAGIVSEAEPKNP